MEAPRSELAQKVNVFGADWHGMATHLEGLRALRVAQLVNSTNHDESMTLRGAIKLIDSLLKEAEAARKAAHERNA